MDFKWENRNKFIEKYKPDYQGSNAVGNMLPTPEDIDIFIKENADKIMVSPEHYEALLKEMRAMTGSKGDSLSLFGIPIEMDDTLEQDFKIIYK